MTREELEKTEWAKKFKRDCHSNYEEGIHYALDPNLIVDISTTKDWSLGFLPMLAITPDCNPDFWLECFNTKNEALALCREMGWKVKR